MRKLLGVVAGVVALGVTVWIIEAISHTIWALPPGVDMSDPAQLAAAIEQMPLAAKVAVVVGWFFGAVDGAWVARMIARWSAAGWIVAAIGVAFCVMTLFIIPHPLWMKVAAVAAPLAGGWVASKLPTKA